MQASRNLRSPIPPPRLRASSSALASPRPERPMNSARYRTGSRSEQEPLAARIAGPGVSARVERIGSPNGITDLKMPGLDGIGLMEKAQATQSDATFVVMTAFGAISSAVEAVKKGAYNYLTKPLDFAMLAVVV